MTWKTQLGERHAVGAEAELIRDTIGYIHDVVEAEINYLNDPWDFGVPIFDNLEPASKLCLLANVGAALMNETPLPPLTAITEGTVAAIFGAVLQLIKMEIDLQKEDSFQDDDRRFFYRTLVLEIARSDEGESDAVEADIDKDEDLRTAESTDMSDWEVLVEMIGDRILWDEDYLYANEILDAAPDIARRKRNRLGIAREYCFDLPPNPEESDLVGIRERLEKIERRKAR